MKKYYQSAVLIVSTFLLLSCGQRQHTYQYFLLHPEEIQASYQACTKLNAALVQQSPPCIAVAKAALAVRPLLLLLTSSEATSQDFGAEILATQMQVAKLQAQLAIEQHQLKLLVMRAGAKEQGAVHSQRDKIAAHKTDLAELQLKVKTMLALYHWVWNVSQQAHR